MVPRDYQGRRRTPTGFRIIAQGCRAAATLGVQRLPRSGYPGGRLPWGTITPGVDTPGYSSRTAGRGPSGPVPSTSLTLAGPSPSIRPALREQQLPSGADRGTNP